MRLISKLVFVLLFGLVNCQPDNITPITDGPPNILIGKTFVVYVANDLNKPFVLLTFKTKQIVWEYDLSNTTGGCCTIGEYNQTADELSICTERIGPELFILNTDSGQFVDLLFWETGLLQYRLIPINE